MSFVFKSSQVFKKFNFSLKNFNSSGLVQSVRSISTIKINEQKLGIQTAHKFEFDQTISEAGNLVGYKPDFSTLKCLFKDDILNFEIHLKKLVETNHPLLETVRSLKNNGKYNMQSWELIVLLLSKCAGYHPKYSMSAKDEMGILESQRILSQVTETIRTAFLVHNGMINFQSLNEVGKGLDTDDELMLGNKLSLLSGDYLMGTASAKIAALRDHDLNILISTSFRDMAELNFLGESDEQNNPLPFDPSIRAKYRKLNSTSNDFEHSDEIDNLKPITIKNFMESSEKEWTLRNILGSASLLGKSCQGAMMLAGNSEREQKLAYLFGKYLALSWKAWTDLDPYNSKTLPENTRFSLVSAPILFHLDHDPTLYQEIIKGRNSIKDVDYQRVHKIVYGGPGVEQTKELQKKYSFIALTALEEFPEGEAKSALKNLIFSTNY